jgi:NAD+ diphosphatase
VDEPAPDLGAGTSLRQVDADVAAALADPATAVVETRLSDGAVRVRAGAPGRVAAEALFAGQGVVAVLVGDRPASDEGWADARSALLGRDDGERLLRAVALGQWRSRSRFCGRCGQPLSPAAGAPALSCPEGHQDFPRLEPAVIVRVVDADDRILLGRPGAWPAGRFSVLAGFVEVGESLEAAVRREVLEEVGVPLADVRYAGSQPWPFPASLMLAFTATATATALSPEDDEIAEARWCTRVELAAAMAAGEVVVPPPLSVAHRLIRDWYGGDLTTWSPVPPASPGGAA